jgi:signal transduction histidine kinase
MVPTGATYIDWAALHEVADSVAATAVSQAGSGFGIEAMRVEVRRLVRALEGATPDAIGDADASLHCDLINGFRLALLRTWTAREEPPSGEVVIATLAALQSIEADLRGRDRQRSTVAHLPDGYEFAAGVAHDLRSPLTSILFLAETLLAGQSGEINDTQRRQLGIIYSAALGLVSVASDIIELVRGGDGLTEREPTLFSITEVLESVHDIVRPMAEEKGLGVHLFPPAVDLRYGYPLALSRVLLNLTTNGLKFTDTGFVEIAVRATGPSRLEFSVRDTGKGYTPEALDTLYEPFRRTRGGRDRWGFSGTGLGLAISRKLVGALGSSLQVETRPKWGTRFYFEVDLPPGPDAGEEQVG